MGVLAKMKRRTTQDIVIDYIKTYAEDGVLVESLMDIANNLGYSNATIHRALKALEKDDLVRIIPADTPRKPNTIIYQGTSKETADIILEGEKLLRRLRELTEDVETYMAEASRIIQYCSESDKLNEQKDALTEALRT